MAEPLERFINPDGEYVVLDSKKVNAQGFEVILCAALHERTNDPFVTWKRQSNDPYEPYRFWGCYFPTLELAYKNFQERV